MYFACDRCWSCCACLSIFTSKGKVDMLCNQSGSAWWSIKEKKEKQNQKTTTKQVYWKQNEEHFIFLFLPLECVAFPLKKNKKLRARFMPWSPLQSCFKSLSLVQDVLIYIYIQRERESEREILFLKMWQNDPNRSPPFISPWQWTICKKNFVSMK